VASAAKAGLETIRYRSALSAAPPAKLVDQIVPEVSRDPKTHEIQGVDYSRLAALLIEAVKAQQAEIRQLLAQIGQLTASQYGQ
jgi:hypothetical protein